MQRYCGLEILRKHEPYNDWRFILTSVARLIRLCTHYSHQHGFISDSRKVEGCQFYALNDTFRKAPGAGPWSWEERRSTMVLYETQRCLLHPKEERYMYGATWCWIWSTKRQCRREDTNRHFSPGTIKSSTGKHCFRRFALCPYTWNLHVLILIQHNEYQVGSYFSYVRAVNVFFAPGC